MNATVRLDHSLLAVEGEHDVHAMLEVAVPEPAAKSRRAPLRLALVLDRSGSMAGEKLAVARRCAQWLVERLGGDDLVSLVAYDDQVRLLAPLGPVSASPLHAALGSLRPGGSTNLSGGWLKGLEQLRGAPADGPRKILLLTDGLANIGVTDPAALVALARNAREAGVGTTTIGLGADFHEELLAAMADAAGGSYHYAATPDEAPRIFADELDGLTSVVAQNVSVEIRPREHVRVVGVLNDFPSVAVAGGVQVELPDAYGGERRRVVFRLHVPRLGELGAVPVADLVLRYVGVGDAIAAHEVTIPVVVNAVSAAEAAAVEPDAEVREEVLVLQAAKAREEAIRLADLGDHDAAQLRLLRVADDLEGAGLAAEADELRGAAPSVAPAMYSATARKQLHFEASTRKRRRRRETPAPDEAA